MEHSMAELRPQLGEHAEALISDTLDRQEATIIKRVMGELAKGPLDPQLAVHAWLEVASIRKLRASLVRQAQVELKRLTSQLGEQI